MSDRNQDLKTIADAAITDEKKLAVIVDTLSGSSRRDRQVAASAVHVIARENPEKLVPYIDVIVDALNRPEGQTRWECLEALALLVDFDARACSKAIQEAETALFDEESGMVRLAAMRYLCKIGATTAARSEKVWPLIDEGIQCCHGDLEFNDMLVAIVDFSSGKLADNVKEELAARMEFDSTNGKGTLKKRATQIVENLR